MDQALAVGAVSLHTAARLEVTAHGLGGSHRAFPWTLRSPHCDGHSGKLNCGDLSVLPDCSQPLRKLGM